MKVLNLSISIIIELVYDWIEQPVRSGQEGGLGMEVAANMRKIKDKMKNTEILYKVQPIRIINVNIFFIETEQGYILVDTGLPNSERKLDRAFQKFGVDPLSVHHIILTHGHLDHIGCLAYAKKITRAKVICHRSIAADLEAGKYEVAVARKTIWRIYNTLGSGLLGPKLKPVIPDFIVEDEFDLNKFGIPGKIVHTPGHSPGSCSIALDNGETLTGDLIRERKPGKFDLGLFFSNLETIIESLKKINSLDPEIIYLSHGTTMSRAEIKNFIETNE